MPALARLLVATDFSEHAARALGWGEEVARRFGAEIVVIHVEEPLAVVPSADLAVERRRGAEKELARLVAHLHGQGFAARSRLSAGMPFEEIVQAARSEQADLIVLGTHGRTGLAHLLMGSVAERVARSASCPVLTVPHRTRSED